jgi:acetate kinase
MPAWEMTPGSSALSAWLSRRLIEKGDICMKILIANVGSTSFKFKLYEMPTEAILAQGKIENIGSKESAYRFSSEKNVSSGVKEYAHYEDAVSASIQFLTDPANAMLGDVSDLDAVGFKTVHGKNIRECRILNDAALAAMEEYNFLASAHNPPYIRAIKIFQKYKIPLVGLFEPAFHRSIPDYAYTYGLPKDLSDKHGIRKYGFHGASHRYISERAPEVAGINAASARIISCHLGGSSSICAIKNGVSIDTSMGFSPQSGLLNQKRCGDLDPFIPLFLQKAENWTPDQVADVLNNKSGLVGISGIPGDMKQIEEAALAGNARAQLAIHTFCYGIKHYIGAYFVALEGCDMIVFTGGIGENSAYIRSIITRGLECIGAKLDPERNKSARGEAVVSTADSKIRLLAIPTNEELIVARETAALLMS